MAPQNHPQAQFVPISPDLDLAALVESTPNFDYVTRLPREMLEEHPIQSLEQLVLLHVVIGGKPLVIEGWEDRIDPYLFSPEWLQNNLDKQVIKARDIPNAMDVQMSMGHYLRNLTRLTNQFNHSNFRDPKKQRLYLKDMDTPEQWANSLKSLIPESLYYLNECIESRTGGDGASLEPNEYNQMVWGKGVAPAGDLMSSLPSEMQALNMMCYIGHEGTYTPAHREMCASLGHNIMVEASENKHGEKEGSSIWFMTETKEREVVSEYFLSMLGHDIEVEKHFAQVNAWKKAPFNVWVVEQKVGDLILIPPLAPHQVWNRGTRTVKAAWNRTTVDTLELALHEALPRARMVCRDEQYKNKAIIYYTLEKYHALLSRDTVEPKMWRYGRIKQTLEDFKRLFALYGEVLVSEMFSATIPTETDVELIPYDSNITCSYCRCNIFNRFLTCKSCNTGPDDTYDICMDCYAMGRSCSCISNLNWVEQWKWSELVDKYEKWRQALVLCDGYFDSQKSPQPLQVARKRYGKKPVAQICQEQLKIRPFHDPSSPPIEESPEGGPANQKTKGKTSPCHVGFHHEWNWKLAFCTTCDTKYAYGVLWRAFDIMPQEVMEDRDWSCPKCLGICSCSRCRAKPSMKPYEPKGTLLGHDTRLVADYRSVESLVDFSTTNLRWLRGDNDDNPRESSRMQKLKAKAEAEKAREDVIDENYLDLPDQPNDDSMVDPALQDSVHADSTIPHDAHNAHEAHMNGSFQSPYTTAGGHQDHGFGEPIEDNSHSWFDGHHDLSFGTNQRPNTEYPAGLLDPFLESDAPASTPGQGYVNPADLTTTRMMGAGYYQQADSADKILYVPPNADETAVDPSKSSISAAANLALSDLQPPAEPETKKRKNISNDGAEDVEFFTSKRQRKLAESKKLPPIPDELSPKPAAQRQPRRSVGKPQTYIDLGEEAMPFSEEDIVPVRQVKAKANGDNEDDDLDLAAEAVNALSAKPITRQDDTIPPVKRRYRRRTPEKTQSSPIPPKKPRQSAWLTRKEANESNGNTATEIPARIRRNRMSTGQVQNDDDESDEDFNIETDDGLFGDPDAPEEPTGGGVRWRTSEKNPAVRVAEPVLRADGSVAKRRGRPPKIHAKPPDIKVEERDSITSPTDRTITVEDPERSSTLDKEQENGRLSSPEDIQDPHVSSNVGEQPQKKRVGRPPKKSITGDERHTAKDVPPQGGASHVEKRKGRPPKSPHAVAPKSAMSIQLSGPTKMLSLKEKLALKGKAFKIVAAKPRRSLDSPDDHTNIRSAPSESTVFRAGSPVPRTATPISMNGTPREHSSMRQTSENLSSWKTFGRRSILPPSMELNQPTDPLSTKTPKSGPTVVRLMNSEAEAGDDASSDSSGDESIPALPPLRPNMARRGGRSGINGR